MTQQKPAARLIPLVQTLPEHPIPLTNAFGEYMEDGLHDLFWLNELAGENPKMAGEILKQRVGLNQQYSQRAPGPTETLRTGDPRQFLSEDIAVVAFHKGEIGIHVEFPLKERGTADELAETIRQWQDRMAPLDSIYNHTRFFIGLGDMTVNRCLTINAFTPLKNGRIGKTQLAPEDRYLMVSPYHEREQAPSIEVCAMVSEVVQVLIQLGLYDQPVAKATEQARTIVRKQQAA